ncbi:MAG: hypothetical protein U0U09_06290 [Cyclobacteriaceae bacterium]
MKPELIYVELKSGYSDNGPAWIGNGFYNRTRKTIYFNGQVFCRSKGSSGNHIDLETGEEYWISGIKKNGTDRHWAGSGVVKIDKSVIDEYLELRNLTSLTKGKYEIVTLDNIPARETSEKLENSRPVHDFNDSLRFKEISDLTDTELNELVEYYDGLDLTSIPKKARKEYIDKIKALEELSKVRRGEKPLNTRQH